MTVIKQFIQLQKNESIANIKQYQQSLQMKNRPPRQEVQTSQEVPPVFSRYRRPASAQQQKKQEDYALILQQQIQEKEKLKAIQKQKEKQEEIALEQRIQQALQEEKQQQSTPPTTKQQPASLQPTQQQLPQQQSQMRSSSASSKKDFRIKKSTVRCQSANKKSDIMVNMRQELFSEQQSRNNYQAHENYLAQLQNNLKELEIMRMIMEEEGKIQQLKMKNQMVMNQYKQKQKEIQNDMDAFSKEMNNLQEIIKGNSKPLKKEVFEQSMLMSQVGVKNSLLNGTSKQMMISASEFNKSYYKDLEKMREQQQNGFEQTKEFSQVAQEFIYNNSKTPFAEENMEESLPSVPKVLDFEFMVGNNPQYKKVEESGYENEFL